MHFIPILFKAPSINKTKRSLISKAKQFVSTYVEISKTLQKAAHHSPTGVYGSVVDEPINSLKKAVIVSNSLSLGNWWHLGNFR